MVLVSWQLVLANWLQVLPGEVALVHWAESLKKFQAVVDKKNARVCIVDKLSAFSIPIFNMVVERGSHVFQVHESSAPWRYQ